MIDTDTYRIAWKHYRAFYVDRTFLLTEKGFVDLIGPGPDKTPNRNYYTFSPEKERKLKLLAGPHHYAVLKLLEIQSKEAS